MKVKEFLILKYPPKVVNDRPSVIGVAGAMEWEGFVDDRYIPSSEGMHLQMLGSCTVNPPLRIRFEYIDWISMRRLYRRLRQRQLPIRR